jgi:hypothetical protein
LLAQLQASERLLERLIKKRDDMSATYQRELAALNRLIYILDVDRWLEAKYPGLDRGSYRPSPRSVDKIFSYATGTPWSQD